MNTLYQNIFLVLAMFCLLFSSCEMGKSIGACPDFKGEKVQHFAQKKNSPKKEKTKKQKTKQLRKEFKTNLDLLVGNFDVSDIIAKVIEEEQAMQWIIPDSTCPLIVLRDKSTIYAEVEKIANDSIYLKFCDSLQQAFTLSKEQIHSIEYDPENFDKKELENIPAQAQMQPQLEGMQLSNEQYAELIQAEEWAKLSLGFGLGALLILFTAIPALIFANKSLKIYKKYPGYRKGRGMAIAGKIIGIIFVIYLALILFLLLLVNGLQ